jgi:hypothetical protein
MLTSPTGATRALAGGNAKTLTSSSSKWIVVVRAHGVQAGLLRGPLRSLTALAGCTVVRAPTNGPPSAAPALMSLAGSVLYAVVESRCLHRPGIAPQTLIAVSLPSGVWRPLARVSESLASLASSPKRVALAYLQEGTGERTLTVMVLDSRSGRHIYSASFGSLGVRPRDTLLADVDDAGDVLVTASGFIPPGWHTEGWWATPRQPSAHELGSIVTANVVHSSSRSPLPQQVGGAASLSAGRIAYATVGATSGEQIKVLDLRSGAIRPVVDLEGFLGVLGVDLSGDELAWAQQGSRLEGGSEVRGGGVFTHCQWVTLGPVQLTSVALRDLPLQPLHMGALLPPGYRPPCIMR